MASKSNSAMRRNSHLPHMHHVNVQIQFVPRILDGNSVAGFGIFQSKKY